MCVRLPSSFTASALGRGGVPANTTLVAALFTAGSTSAARNDPMTTPSPILDPSCSPFEGIALQQLIRRPPRNVKFLKKRPLLRFPPHTRTPSRGDPGTSRAEEVSERGHNNRASPDLRRTQGRGLKPSETPARPPGQRWPDYRSGRSLTQSRGLDPPVPSRRGARRSWEAQRAISQRARQAGKQTLTRLCCSGHRPGSARDRVFVPNVTVQAVDQGSTEAVTVRRDPLSA